MNPTTLKSIVNKPSILSLIDKLPHHYAEVSFENYEVYDTHSKNVLQLCKEFIPTRNKRGLYLFGAVGAGKTHLICSICKSLDAIPSHKWFMKAYDENEEDCIVHDFRTRKIIFINAKKYFEDMSGFNKTDVIEKILQYDGIIFDDLSLMSFSDNQMKARAENLYWLIDEVYSREKGIYITSNFTPEDLSTIEPRVTSRLAEFCKFIKFDGEDYRFKKATKPELN